MHHAAGELVDDHHLAVLDDVVLVALEQLVGAQRLVDVVDDGDVRDVVERAVLGEHGRRPASMLFDRSRCRLRSAMTCALLLVELVSRRVLDQLVHQGVDGAGRARSGPRVGPEMISGVRASSIRMESTSSTMAKVWPRWTISSLA